eukprot:XP_008647013.1 atherin-like [Zea mays]
MAAAHALGQEVALEASAPDDRVLPSADDTDLVPTDALRVFPALVDEMVGQLRSQASPPSSAAARPPSSAARPPSSGHPARPPPATTLGFRRAAELARPAPARHRPAAARTAAAARRRARSPRRLLATGRPPRPLRPRQLPPRQLPPPARSLPPDNFF